MSFEFPAIRFADTFKVNQRNGLTKPKSVRGAGLPMVNMGELFAHSRIRDIDMDKVPVSEKEKVALLQPNDLLFARQSLVLAGAGQCSIFLGHRPTVFESHLIRCRLDEEMYEPKYYYYFFKSSLGRKAIRSIVEQGAAASGIKGSDLIELEVPAPPLQTQKLIANFFDNLDSEIENLHHENTALESIAQRLFRSWFVNFDPVHAKAAGKEPEAMSAELAAMFPGEFEDSELGPIPKGWIPGFLGGVARNVRQQVKPEHISKDTPYVGLEHVERKCLTLTQWATAETVESGKFKFGKGDILFGKLRPYFHKVAVAPVEGVCSTDILVIQPFEEKWHGFVTQHVFSKAFIDYATQLSDGARMPRTNWTDTAKFPIAIPPVGIAQRFDELWLPMLKSIHFNINLIRTLAQLRDHLLPRLISGKLSLEEAEQVVEEAMAA